MDLGIYTTIGGLVGLYFLAVLFAICIDLTIEQLQRRQKRVNEEEEDK